MTVDMSERGEAVVTLTEEISWDRAADVVVVGGGIAGFSTALNAADMGASVLLVEKGQHVGGTSCKAAGALFVPNNRFMREAGLVDPREDFMRFLARVGRPLLYDPDHPHLGLPRWEYDLIGVYWDSAAQGVERLEALGALRTTHVPDWSSYNEVPEDKAPFGRVLFTLAAGGELGSGASCMALMREKAQEMGVTMLTEHRVSAVYRQEDGRIAGVRALTTAGPVSIRSHRAVVFATGGFVHNDALRREFLNGFYPGGCAARTGEGDLIPIAKALGVPLYHMSSAWGSPLVLEQALDEDPGLIANFSLPGDSILEVNKYGLRIGNEKATYNDRTQAHFIWDPATAGYPNWLTFAVWDQRNSERFAYAPGVDIGNFIPPAVATAPSPQSIAGAGAIGASSPPVADRWKYILQADTLEELSVAIDERLAALGGRIGEVRLAPNFAERLAESIERFNAFARAGRDDDFHRGESAIERVFHGGRAADNGYGNETLHPLAESGPYFATILAPGAIDTKGGPLVNARMQMLDGFDRPIPSLYGVGNCVASASGQAYWSGGGTFGPYIGYGLVAATNAVSDGPKTLEPTPTTPSA